MISDVIRFEESVCSDLSGNDPLTEPQCSGGDTLDEGTVDQGVCAAPPPSCRIRKCSPSVEAAAKRRRQEADRSTARPLSTQRHPEGGIQAQDGHRPGLHPSRVKKLSSHDLSVESKKRRSCRKRKLDQLHDVGQKKICFR